MPRRPVYGPAAREEARRLVREARGEKIHLGWFTKINLCRVARGERPLGYSTTFKDTLFNKAILGQILADRLKELSAGSDRVREEINALRADLAKIERELARTLEIALASDEDAKTVADALRVKEREKSALQAKLEHLDGEAQEAESFDPVQWLKDISDLLSTLPTVFGLAVGPAGARRILRECLPQPLKVTPDPEGGWTYEGVGSFEQEGLQRAMKEIKGQIAPDRPTSISPTELVPPG